MTKIVIFGKNKIIMKKEYNGRMIRYNMQHTKCTNGANN